MRKIWLPAYPPGVPAEVDARAYTSLNDLFERSCRHFYSHTAYSCLGGALTYEDAERLSRELAIFVQSDLALAPGERLAIMLPNLLQYPVALFGALRAGLVVVKDASAVGMPDERTGEAVVLFVVAQDPGLTANALREHCARELTGYKLPKRIEFRAQLPKRPIGKTLRRELVPAAGTPHG